MSNLLVSKAHLLFSSALITGVMVVSVKANAGILNFNRLSTRDRLMVDRWLAKEDADRIQPGHTSAVHLVRDAFSLPEKTPYSVLIISGLFNSPESMSGLAEHFYQNNMNVINMRLAGHYEHDETALARTVEWEQWKEQTDEAFELAQRLGHKVILVGHSTGALLLTWAAFERPEAVAGMALFSPAFNITPASLYSAMISKRFGFNPTIEGRLISGHAGLEVHEMATQFRRFIHGGGQLTRLEVTDFSPLSGPFSHMPVWVADTAIDMIIDVSTVDRFLHALKSEGSAPRVHYSVPACELVLHDRIISPKNNAWQPMLKSMTQTLPGH